jgi:hypothetical protein
MSFSIFRWYIVKKASREENLVFVVRVNITSNFEYFVAFSNEDVQIMLRDIFILFKVHDFKKFLLLKIVDLITIRRRRENYFREFSNLDCSRLLHLSQKFDSSTFFIQLIELTLQNSVIRRIRRRFLSRSNHDNESIIMQYDKYEMIVYLIRIVTIRSIKVLRFLRLLQCEYKFIRINQQISLAVGLGFGQKFKSDPRVDVRPGWTDQSSQLDPRIDVRRVLSSLSETSYI